MARDKFIKVRVTKEEQERYNAAAEKRGMPLGVFVRKSIERLVKRMEKQGEGG